MPGLKHCTGLFSRRRLVAMCCPLEPISDPKTIKLKVYLRGLESRKLGLADELYAVRGMDMRE